MINYDFFVSLHELGELAQLSGQFSIAKCPTFLFQIDDTKVQHSHCGSRIRPRIFFLKP